MSLSTASIFSSVSLVALATPAFAQTAPAAPVETTPQKTQEQQQTNHKSNDNAEEKADHRR